MSTQPLAAELIVANAPDPVFVCDLNGKILVANDAVSQLLGLHRDEVLEQSLQGFSPRRKRESSWLPCARLSNAV